MIKRLLFLLLLFGFGSSAFAAEPVFKFTIAGTMYNNYTAACTAYALVYGPKTSYTGNVVGGPPPATTNCSVVYTSSPTNQYLAFSITSQYFCYDGGTRNTGVAWASQCAVAAPAGFGDPPPDCTSTLEHTSPYMQASGTLAAPGALPVSVSGCAVKNVSLAQCVEKDGSKYCRYWVTNSGPPLAAPAVPQITDAAGASATPAASPPISAGSPSGSCPKGTVEGGIDSGGIPICMGTGTTPPSAPNPQPTTVVKTPVITSNPDGSTTTVAETQITNVDGSVTKNIVTTNTASDGTVSKSGSASTSASTAGTPGRTDVPTDKSDLCKVNPMLAVCQNSTVTGTCGAIACTGDAIQCAQLRAAAIMQCQQQSDIDGLNTSSKKLLGDQILSGADPMQAASDANLRGTTTDLSNPNLDSTGFVGDRSCFPNKTFTVSGRTVVMDFSTICEKITPLRYAVMACASLIAYLIVAKSVLG